MCTCAVHCTDSGYHEKACCDAGPCQCWCHARSRQDPIEAERREMVDEDLDGEELADKLGYDLHPECPECEGGVIEEYPEGEPTLVACPRCAA